MPWRMFLVVNIEIYDIFSFLAIALCLFYYSPQFTTGDFFPNRGLTDARQRISHPCTPPLRAHKRQAIEVEEYGNVLPRKLLISE